VSPSSTLPVTDATATSSCIRLSARSNVVLPEPDGPMIAVTSFPWMSKVTLRTAGRPAKETETSSSRMTGLPTEEVLTGPRAEFVFDLYSRRIGCGDGIGHRVSFCSLFAATTARSEASRRERHGSAISHTGLLLPGQFVHYLALRRKTAFASITVTTERERTATSR
jgi:hypothetical protein